jgi:hypothetical protein
MQNSIIALTILVATNSLCVGDKPLNQNHYYTSLFRTNYDQPPVSTPPTKHNIEQYFRNLTPDNTITESSSSDKISQISTTRGNNNKTYSSFLSQEPTFTMIDSKLMDYNKDQSPKSTTNNHKRKVRNSSNNHHYQAKPPLYKKYKKQRKSIRSVSVVNSLLNLANEELLSDTQTMTPNQLYYSTGNPVQNRRYFSVQTHYESLGVPYSNELYFPAISITERSEAGWELYRLSKHGPRPYVLPLSYLTKQQSKFKWDQNKIAIFISEAEKSTQTLT